MQPKKTSRYFESSQKPKARFNRLVKLIQAPLYLITDDVLLWFFMLLFNVIYVSFGALSLHDVTNIYIYM